MTISHKLLVGILALAYASVAAPPPADRIATVSPGPMRLPASASRYIRFHFHANSKAGETVTVSFQWSGSQTASASGFCRLDFAPDAQSPHLNPASSAHCAISPRATVSASTTSGLDAVVPIAFTKPGNYRLYIHTASTGWSSIGDYQVSADTTDAATFGIESVGVTPTQAVLAFTPPDPSGSCQVQVTSTRNGDTWDYSTLVPDTDPNVYPGADNADLNDPAANGPQNRGFAMPDGTRAIVIGRRTAEYSPYTYRMHSRALQAATPHQAWITCGAASATIDFSTANIMPGVTFQDAIPADPDRPGDYSYPTLGWNSRTEGVVDPQSGLLIRPINLPSDSQLNVAFAPWKGTFGTPVPVSRNAGLATSAFFLPASVPKFLYAYYNMVVNEVKSGWLPSDATLTSFLPTGVRITCPLCVNAPITVCLTADGVTCAQDRNILADPNAPADPNTTQKGILGTTINCTGTCTFPSSDPRWTDSTPMLAAWHPHYAAGAPNTVLPNFQFDTVKLRTTPIACDGSSLISRAQPAGAFVGAAFNPLWTTGTPLTIDSSRYTVNHVVDENTLIVNESCPANAQSLVADTFGLLVTGPAKITAISPGGWQAGLQEGNTQWDGSQQFTNCSNQPVFWHGKSGWHCVLSYSVYWIAQDGSIALPMGTTGFRSTNLGNLGLCQAAYFDDLDPNTFHCMFNTPNVPGKHSFVDATFFGDHEGLDKAVFTGADADTTNSYLPFCQSTSPPVPNNCWRITPLNKTGTNSLFILEDAVRDAAPTAWNNSAFPAALKDGYVYSYISQKVDRDHLVVMNSLGQNSYGFNSLLEFSNPRGSVNLRSVLPSWTAAAGVPAAAPTMRWSGVHAAGGSPWGATKVAVYPTFFRGCCSVGQGFYTSNVVAVKPAACPASVSGGACATLTVDGQPGVAKPSIYEPVNDAKTRKPGYGYLTDIAPGDVMCAPLDNDFYSYCLNSIPNGRFEHLRVLSTVTNADGSLSLTVQRNLGGTVSMPLPASQTLFMMPSFCSYEYGSGCSSPASVWDWSANTVELINVGGESHQFSAYDSAQNQIVSVTNVAYLQQDPLCYSSTFPGYSYCYSLFAGKVDPLKSITSQVPSLFNNVITQNPPFGIGTLSRGVTGLGDDSAVDSHPGMPQMGAAPDAEKTWFIDGRPFNGMTSPLPPPLQVAPAVYRFPFDASAADPATALTKYKELPMMAACGLNALHEVTAISSQTPYSYCVALSGGDCMPGSSPGDSYVNCPLVQPAAKPANVCPFAGYGGYTPEVRDVCLILSSGYAMSLTQIGFASQSKGIWTILPHDLRLRSTRLLTRGFSRYRIIDQYWNPKTTPDGGVLLFRTLFAAGYNTRLLMAKLPPFPDITQDPLDRRGFVPTPAVIDPPPAGATSVKVQFGYDTNLRCLTRPEACEARADFDPTGTSVPFYFSSEAGPAGIPCDSGACPATISLPGISQRVLYYRPVYQINGTPVNGIFRVAVVPDPVPVPGSSQ